MYYMAPLEGVTDFVYRGLFDRYFGPADKYFIPFLTPAEGGKLSRRQKADVLWENNEGLASVPQILTNSPEEFAALAVRLHKWGYREVNLNLGCPSRTVVSKGKGAGLLREREYLREFLDRIFDKADVEISIKTRIGAEDPEEFDMFLELYNQYPVKELIVHPRTLTEYYKGAPHLDAYIKAMKKSRHPLCYNGDLFTAEDVQRLRKKCPGVERLMFGRGLIGNPSLLSEIKGERKAGPSVYLEFQNALVEAYREKLGKEKYVLAKMKELWTYRGMTGLLGRTGIERIQRTRSLKEYMEEIKRSEGEEVNACDEIEKAGNYGSGHTSGDR